MANIELDGLKFHYRQSGAGPDVVLVHAFTSNMAVWLFTDIVEKLAADFRVTMYDLRGHGNSARPESGYNSAVMAGDLKKLHQALELEPALLVGHSYGGTISMHAAVLYPEIVRGVILSDSYFPGLAEIEPNMLHADVWADVRRVLAEADAHIGESVNFTELFHAVAGLRPEQMEIIKQELGAPGARWLAQLGQLSETRSGDEMFEVAGLTAEKIASVGQPVFAFYDEHSPFMATCRYLEEHLSRCTVERVPGAKHVAILQNSPVFVEMVQRRLREMAGLT
ncbi:MAG: alpha/beta hydrolase [Pirellulaceae bacterium]